MKRQASLGVALVGAGLLSGCFMFAGDCVEPITAHIAPGGIGRSAPIAVGQCPRVVEYDGELYTIGDYLLTVPESAIHPIGTASGANPAVGNLADATVYAIEDVDPAEAIALLHPAHDGVQRVIVAVRGMGSGNMPSELCAYVDAAEQAEVVITTCGDPPGSSPP